MPGTRFMNPADSTASRARCWAICVFVLSFSLWHLPARAVEAIRCPLADGFDFPVGKPEAAGYYKSRGFYPNGHLGEDWNGRGGGDSDLGDPIYAIAGGVVVHSDNVGVGWGNVVIVRHAYRDASGKIDMVDSLYGHLLARNVKLHQIVARGQQVGTMGSNNGQYYVHLHLEIRKNLQIGMNRSQFARDYSNYYSPTQFINAHRKLSSSFQKFEMPVNTFAPYGKSLAEMGSSSPSKGLNIPVFPSAAPSGTLPGVVLTQKGSKPTTVASAPSSSGQTQNPPLRSSRPTPSRTDSTPPAPPTTEEDFWSRLKSKLKQGKLTDEPRRRSSP